MFVDQKKTKIIHNKCNQRLHVFKIDIGLNFTGNFAQSRIKTGCLLSQHANLC